MRTWLTLILLALPTWALPRDQTRMIAAPGQEPVAIEARVIEETPPIVRAEGDVLFQQGVGPLAKRLTADQMSYNYEQRTGFLTQAAFTTCDRPHPDYRITAREIRLTPDQRLKATRVRIYLGNLRILSVPRLTINVGPRAARQALLPRPGYDSRDGLFVSVGHSLVSSEKTDLGLRLRLTTKENIQGGLVGGYALRGSARLAPPYIPDVDSELRRESVLQPLVEEEACVFPQQKPQPHLLSAFGALLVRERAFDIDQTDLLVTRLPEIGVRYVSPQVCAVTPEGKPVIGVQAETRTSWGRFRERPGNGYIDRWDARGTTSTTIATYRHNTALRGMGLARYSRYSTGDSFAVLGGALDISRIFPRGAFASLRLIAHARSGSTPFSFDDIDIPYELQSAGRYVRGRNTYGVVLDYDLQKRSLRDWEVSIARRLHCLEPSISWRNRFRQISFNISVLGL